MGSKQTALITGITGQVGSYLAEHLLSQGYTVYGLVRRSSNSNTERIDHLRDRITLVTGDLLDERSLVEALDRCQPDEVYNLAAQSFVGSSWTQPTYTAEVTGLGVTRLLEAIRIVNDKIRMYQASSSEIFGKVREVPQRETTPFHPRSPYGVAKMFGYWTAVNYRESYGMHVSNGILFNTESPRRGLEFVTRKITYGLARIYHGLDTELRLGNLEAKRDWGHARDAVRAMHLMLKQPEPDDYVIATGETHSVREFCQLAFNLVGLNYEEYVVSDPQFMRPAEVDLLVGDATKARTVLGWKPTITFEELVKEMVLADLERVGEGIR